MGIVRLATTLLKAWRTLEPAHWSEFADAWQCGGLRSYGHWLIAGKILNASERYEEARDAFTKALARKPDAAAYIGLGRALKGMGKRQDAIRAFETAYRKGAREEAARQLCRYGARDHIPVPQGHVFPVRAYSEFIELHPVATPPALSQEATTIALHIDARDCSQEALTRTIESLVSQVHADWTCSLLLDHASPALPPKTLDSRFSGTMRADVRGWHLELPAGAILDSHALSWFVWAISATGCATIYADYDHYQLDGLHLRRCAPVLHGMPDQVWFASDLHRPAIMATSTELRHDTSAHIPRILASFPLMEPPGIETATARPSRQGRIAVIIPTKDNPGLLQRCIETLLETAAQPGRVEFRIVDNGSIALDRRWLSAHFGEHNLIEIVRFDEPFNWSRANNLGAAGANQDHLLFLNDDTEMRTRGWDDALIDLLEHDARVGIVGAQLLYPSGDIQHAGFAFGMDNGPQHEGRWMAGSDPGPNGRWQAAHCTAAVTGAFMAMRRTVFHEVGPFDEQHFAVDFSDVDICLRARWAGFQIVYAPELKLLHLESFSRGYNRSRRKRERARAEFAALKARWGDTLDLDPGYNPYWTREGCSFDGFREPPEKKILRHIEQSARPNPWRPTQAPCPIGSHTQTGATR